MTIQPLGERVLLEVKEAQEKTSGGILIPQASQEKTQEGVVLAVGDSDLIKVKVGDVVMYDKYAGTSFKVGDKEQLIVKIDDILAIVK